ncbi:hypothetical protein CC78DRAFT_611400 [Lojkania enalia]|uniref:Uncharacterized protein n=1 Tax=Lojkania enalia TaxID=147567 RepID=A0A9P4TQD7_9PLEO|nr:hypothetical protein CC78DRAFT_611400 [Didymosphaeria enalia]
MPAFSNPPLFHLAANFSIALFIVSAILKSRDRITDSPVYVYAALTTILTILPISEIIFLAYAIHPLGSLTRRWLLNYEECWNGAPLLLCANTLIFVRVAVAASKRLVNRLWLYVLSTSTAISMLVLFSLVVLQSYLAVREGQGIGNYLILGRTRHIV